MIRFFVVSFTVVILNAALSDKASVCVCVCVCVCVWGGGGGGGGYDIYDMLITSYQLVANSKANFHESIWPKCQ